MPHNFLTLEDIDPEWKASGRWRVGAAPGEPGGMVLPVSTVFVHHTVSPDTGDVVADVAGPCDTDQHNFGKVSYSFMIHASTNTIVEVEGVHRGAHTINNDQRSLNGVSFGIGVIGNFHPPASPPPFRAPTGEHVRLIRECITDRLVGPGHVTAGFAVLGHRDAPYATACCGDALYALLPEIRRLTYVGPAPIMEDDDVAKLMRTPDGAIWCVSGAGRWHVEDAAQELPLVEWNIVHGSDVTQVTPEQLAGFDRIPVIATPPHPG